MIIINIDTKACAMINECDLQSNLKQKNLKVMGFRMTYPCK